MATKWRKLTPEQRKEYDAQRDAINVVCEALKAKHTNLNELRVMKSKEFYDTWLPKHPMNGLLLRWTAKADRYIGVVSVKHCNREYNFSYGTAFQPLGALNEALKVANVNMEHVGVDLSPVIRDLDQF